MIAAISVGTRKVITNLAKLRAILPDIVEKNYSFINIVQSPSTERATQVGTMTDGNISGTDRNNYFVFHQVILKTRQRETKLFRFSRDTNTEQLMIKKKRCHCPMASLQLLQWNFHFSLSPKISASRQGLLTQ